MPWKFPNGEKGIRGNVSVEKIETQQMMDLSKEKKPARCKWVFNLAIEQYKAWLDAKGQIDPRHRLHDHLQRWQS